VNVGDEPQGVAVTPNGEFVYVTNFKDDTVSVISTSDNMVVDTVIVGDGPIGVAVRPNGELVYVVNSREDTVSVIRTSDNVLVDIVNVGIGPLALGLFFASDCPAPLPEGPLVIIPTMNQWGIIIATILLGFFAVIALRRRTEL